MSHTFDDVEGANAELTSNLVPRPTLFVVCETARPLAGGARYRLDDVTEIEIGRGPSRVFEKDGARAILRLPDKLASSRHARVVRDGRCWVLEDLGSRNGTRVGGARVDSVELHDGALFEIGGTFLSFYQALPLHPGAPRVLEVRPDEGPPGTQTLLPSLGLALDDLARVARSPLSVLVFGESGTGKELVARALHTLSDRRGAFIAINCGALPPNLVEATLFGHARGAFSGAVRDEPGLVRASDKGTLFLDEIAELPAASQATLLRVLQEREVLPVGATRPVSVDLRVVAATHQPVDRAAHEVFRSDLYARLAGFVLRLPALRARREDLGILIGAVLRQIAPDRAGSLALTAPAFRALASHPWGLNIRELHQALSVALVLMPGTLVDLCHLPENLRSSAPPAVDVPTPNVALPTPVPASFIKNSWGSPARRNDANDALRQDLLAHLRAQGGNISEVARLMGRTRMQIHRWMKRFGIDPTTFRP
ncbi:MAG: sigma 54-interacting transcriptional regulator [Polyangiaceae bacterium]